MSVNDVLYDEGGAVHNVRNTTIGATGDGTTDGSAAFYNLAPGGHYVVPAGVYRFGASGVIPDSVTLELKHGAVLRPDASTQVTLLGPLIAGASQWIDLTAGGALRFDIYLQQQYTANRFISHYRPQWWGVTGDGSTNDQPALARMVDSVPDYCSIKFASQMLMNLDSTWTVSNRNGIVFSCDANPLNTGSEGFASAFRYAGPAGDHAVLFLDRARHCVVRGFSFDAGGLANVCVDLDGYGNGIGTQCIIEHNLFGGAGNTADFVGVRISQTVTNNQEYHTIRHNVVYGGGSETRNVYVSTTASSTVITAGAAAFSSSDVGKSIRIANVGPAGGVLDTTILSVQSGTEATLGAAASATVTAAYAALGKALGNGIRIGPSANAKRIIIDANNIIGCQYGIRAEGGSFHALHNSFTRNEVNISVTNLSEPSYDDGSNSEYSRQHLDLTTGMPFFVRSGRFDIGSTIPNGAHFNLPTTNAVLIVACGMENHLPDASSHVFASPHGNRLVSIGNRFSDGMSIAQIGVDVDTRWISLFDGWIFDKPADTWLGGRVLSEYADYDGTIIGKTYSSGGGDDPYHTAGVRGEALMSPQGAYDAVAVGVQAVVGQNGLLNNVNFRAIEAVLPVSATQQAKLVEGMHIMSPAFTGGGGAQQVTGIVIEPMRVVGGPVYSGGGIDQRGPLDVNRFAGITSLDGRTFQKAPPSPPYDPELQPAQVTFYLDEANDALMVRVKYSDGASLKTGTIALT